MVGFSDTGQSLRPRTYSVVEDWPIRRSKHHALCMTDCFVFLLFMVLNLCLNLPELDLNYTVSTVCVIVTVTDYKEKAVEYRPGTVLLYGMDTLHRGTPVKPGAERLTHHFGFKRKSAECKIREHSVRLDSHTTCKNM